jgi:hypothetical protein
VQDGANILVLWVTCLNVIHHAHCYSWIVILKIVKLHFACQIVAVECSWSKSSSFLCLPDISGKPESYVYWSHRGLLQTRWHFSTDWRNPVGFMNRNVLIPDPNQILISTISHAIYYKTHVQFCVSHFHCFKLDQTFNLQNLDIL